MIVKWWGADDLEEVRGEIDGGANTPANQSHAQGMCLFTNEHGHNSKSLSNPHKSHSEVMSGAWSPLSKATKSSSYTAGVSHCGRA